MFHTQCERVWSEDCGSEGRATFRCFKEVHSPNLFSVTETWKENRLGSELKILFTQLTRKVINGLQNIANIWTEFIITLSNGITVGAVCLSHVCTVCLFGMSYRPESRSVSEFINKKNLDQDYRMWIWIQIIFEEEGRNIVQTYWD